MAASAEQRNPYKGYPPRSWVRLRLIHPLGHTKDVECIADTGNPFSIIVDSTTLAHFMRWDAAGVETNFGRLSSGRLRLVFTELDFQIDVLGYGSDAVAEATKTSCPDFRALVGLPLLRFLQYGRDSDYFWIRAKA